MNCPGLPLQGSASTRPALPRRIARRARLGLCAALLGLAALPGIGQAASSEGCEGGGFTVYAPGGTQVTPGQLATLPVNVIGGSLLVRGRYVEFTVDTATFGIRDYTLTGVANPRELTSGQRTVVFASKTPDHRGLALTSDVTVDARSELFFIGRSGPGLTMKVQAKDCATGGIFQMEPERGDDSATLITHVLAPGMVYFDNQAFRDREGEALPYKDTTVVVTNRVNFGSETQPKLVGRDSPQVATRVNHPTCTNVLPNRASIGGTDTLQHCGGLTQWMVASGGRMGQVMGEDAVEVAPPATTCTHKCRAQNRVRGQAVTLPAPFPRTNVLRPRLP